MSAPESVIELANARIQAREAKDFSLADRLRNSIAQAGFEVVDVAEGYELREKAAFITLTFALLIWGKRYRWHLLSMDLPMMHLKA